MSTCPSTHHLDELQGKKTEKASDIDIRRGTETASLVLTNDLEWELVKSARESNNVT